MFEMVSSPGRQKLNWEKFQDGNGGHMDINNMHKMIVTALLTIDINAKCFVLCKHSEELTKF